MSVSCSIVHRLSPSAEGAYADMRELLKHQEPLANCYFADNDLIAAGAIKAFLEVGYCVPQDIAVVGFDNIPICIYTNPLLTTIHVPNQYMGQTAVRMLHTLIGGEEELPIKIEIAAVLKKKKLLKEDIGFLIFSV